MSNIDDLLDATLDDLEDLPEFKPFPPGAHKVEASFELKKINDKAAIELDFKLLETVELSDPALPEEEQSKPGDTSNTMFMLDNEYGRGNLKKTAAPFYEALGCSSLRELCETAKNIECMIITSIRVDKKDPDDVRRYLNVKEIQVV